MKIFAISLVAVALGLSAWPQSASAGTPTARIEVLLRVNTNPAKDKDGKYHGIFVLMVKNRSASAYPLGKTLDERWRLEVHRQGSVENEIHWHNPDTQDSSKNELIGEWIDKGLHISSLAPGEEVQATATWEAPENLTYKVEATFIPTKEIIEATLVLPPRTANILFTGRLMGYYRVPDRQSLEAQNCEYSPQEAKDPTKDPSPDAKVFFDKFGRSPVNEIRLGMGDNFAPNYYSRAFNVSAKEAGKDRYNWVGGKWKSFDFLASATAHPSPEELKGLEDIQNGRGAIPMDNVACFLSQAHYDAIVPAKHDFYYGPERLRELARLLASPKEKDLQPVQMLAANMVIKTTWAKSGHEPVPDSAKHQLPFATKYAPRKTPACPQATNGGCSFEITTPSDGGSVFPWMRLVHIAAKGWNKNTKPQRVSLCKATGSVDPPGDPDRFVNQQKDDCQDGQPLYYDDAATKAAQKESEGDSDSQELIYSLVPTPRDPQDAKPISLIPGHNYAVCIFDPNPDEKAAPRTNQHEPERPYCVRFSIYVPFLQYPDWPKAEYGQGADQYNPRLYVLKNPGGKGETQTPVAIFGIVDPELLADVGADNYSWQTMKNGRWERNYNTQVLIVDPVETLTQLQDFFDSNDGKNFQGIRVLMAEMSPGRAKQLAERLPANLRFDVILSAADDAQATPNQDVHIQPAVYVECAANVALCEKQKTAVTNGASATPASFVAVPPTHAAAKDRQLQARELTVTTDGVSYWNYSLSGDPISVPVEEPSWLTKASNGFWEQVCQALAAGDKKAKDKCDNQVRIDGDTVTERAAKTAARRISIQQLALWSIRKKYQVDIAILQERDFYLHGVEDYLYEHCQPSPDGTPKCDTASQEIDVQQILDRVIWKGDFIKTQSVTGSILKTVLKESDQFADREKKAYLHVSDAGRAIVKLGIEIDPKDSDSYLINSKPLDPNSLYTVATSDYIALGDTGYPELAKPPAGDPDQPARPQGDLYRISSLACVDMQKGPDNCEVSIHANDYFDQAANRVPDDPRAGNTNLRKFYAWTFWGPRLGQQAQSTDDSPKAPEKRINWEWSFDQLSVGFSGLTHTETTEKLSQEFGGVLNSQVNANHFHSWDWDADSKLTFYHPKADWFVEETLQYSSSFIAQIDASRSETQSRNFLAFDGGTYFHLYPWRGKELPQFSLVLSGHFDTQVAGVLTNLAVNTVPASASPATLTFDQGRTMFLAGRPGLRWQNRKSYIEGGLEGGSVLNTIKQFDITATPSGPTLSCTLEDSVSLTNCINVFNQNNPNTPVTASSSVRVERRPIDRYGTYWKIKITVPINPIVSYSFRDRSEYYFLSRGDNLLNTRFLHELVNTVKFMVLPNLSFEPTYTIFLYENKLDYNFLVQQQYSVKINYSFSLSNLHESKRQFRYAKGSSE